MGGGVHPVVEGWVKAPYSVLVVAGSEVEVKNLAREVHRQAKAQFCTLKECTLPQRNKLGEWTVWLEYRLGKGVKVLEIPGLVRCDLSGVLLREPGECLEPRLCGCAPVPAVAKRLL